jgi:hypothetical protein
MVRAKHNETRKIIQVRVARTRNILRSGGARPKNKVGQWQTYLAVKQNLV